jgi:lysophospholipase L1-like esterase
MAGPAYAADADQVEALGDSHVVRSVMYWAPDAIGFWHGGYTAPQVARRAVGGADILVLGAGTNDRRLGGTLAQMETAYRSAEIKSNAFRVIVLALPPRNGDGRGTNIWNAELRKIAANRGWEFYDAWSGYRAENGRYVVGCGCTPDGVHATDAVYRKISTRIVKWIERGVVETP